MSFKYTCPRCGAVFDSDWSAQNHLAAKSCGVACCSKCGHPSFCPCEAQPGYETVYRRKYSVRRLLFFWRFAR